MWTRYGNPEKSNILVKTQEKNGEEKRGAENQKAETNVDARNRMKEGRNEMWKR